MKLIVGLGNPGEEYAETRHNVGFMTTKLLAERNGIALKRKGYQGIYGTGRLGVAEVTFLLPQTFMNRSGQSVVSASRSLGIQPGDLIVIHDDIDLDFGCLKIKAGGGHGGHNGLKSLCALLGDSSFMRIRIGIGRPYQNSGDVTSYVLGRFNFEERKDLEEFISHAADALEMLVAEGLQATMNKYNNRNLLTEPFRKSH